MKGIANAIIVIVLLGIVGIKFYSAMDADSTRVSQLVTKSEKNEEAKILVARFLNETPAPTVGDIVHVEGEVEKILVRGSSQIAASDAGLKPVALPDESSGIEIKVEPEPPALVKIALLIMALAIILVMLGAYKRAKAGS